MSRPRYVKKEVTEYLRELHLPAIRRSFEEAARQAERETMGYEQYLLELVERECQERCANRIARLLQASRLPLEKTLENFDLKRLPAKAGRQVKALLDDAFLDRRENILAFGNPGSGKTHLLSGLGQELIRQGRRVAFTTCVRLVQDLLRAKKQLRLSRAIKKLAYYEALALEIRREIEVRHEEADQLRCRAIDRAQIEADLVQRRFMLVDPGNRLVADTLEREWNEKLRALAGVREERERARQQDSVVLDEAVRK